MNPETERTDGQMSGELWLAPLRGVTIRAFRETFAAPIREAGFDGAFAPFIPANPGIRVNDRLLADLRPFPGDLPLVPQVITKHPEAMRELLKGFKNRGFARADLNAGCPFPMIVRRGRGSGLLRTPDMLERLVAAGCEEMGPDNFSVKIRLGLERPDELLRLMPMLNRYPLAALTVHARTARQMYTGACDRAAFAAVCAASANPVIYNGDIKALKGFNGFNGLKGLSGFNGLKGLMVGRGFVRALGTRPDAAELLRDYIARSQTELSGDRPVLGRMKELLAYWAESSPHWHRLWSLVKICRSVEELLSIIR
jgi:tRNA-dihydrouridine synthase